MSDQSEKGDGQTKPCICDVCGYRIKDGIGTHDRCEGEADAEAEQEPEEDPRADWPECDRHGKYMPGERMCPDCFDEAKAMGATPLGGN